MSHNYSINTVQKINMLNICLKPKNLQNDCFRDCLCQALALNCACASDWEALAGFPQPATSGVVLYQCDPEAPAASN